MADARRRASRSRCVVALALGFITLRMQGHYLPLATIAWGISLFFLFGNLELLGGHTGITGIPALIARSASSCKDERHFYCLIWAIVLAALWATHNLLDSRPGRAMRALKGGLEMAEAFGVERRAAQDRRRSSTPRCSRASPAGCTRTCSASSIRRRSASTRASSTCSWRWSAAPGSVWGAVVGATLITLLKQMLQDVLPQLLGRAGNFEIVVFGVLMILLLQFARDGVWPWVARLLPRRSAARRLPRRAGRCRRATQAARTTARCSKCSGARKQFGGLVAVNDLTFDDPRRRDPRPDRAQRRRQEHDVRLISGALPLTRGRRSCFAASRSAARAAVPRSRGSASAARSSTCKLLPRMTVLDNVALGAYLRGQRRRRRARRCGSTAREEARTRAEAARADRARRPRRASARRRRQPAARQAADRRDRARARRRSVAAAARRARGGPALPRKAGARGAAARAAARRA